jgi:ribonuclease HII
MATTPKTAKSRTNPDLSEEQTLYQAGYRYIAGVDEAGRGAWAGPLVAAAVILPLNPNLELEAALAELATHLEGVNDSKKLSELQREKLFETIVSFAYTGVGSVSALAIDLNGVGVANRLAWRCAIGKLPIPADFLLLDAFKLPELSLPQRAIIRGDAKSLSIAAASIVAKVTRDRWLSQLENEYPAYGLGKHKGYGTALHAKMLEKNGTSPIHRYSYRPVWQKYLAELGQVGQLDE